MSVHATLLVGWSGTLAFLAVWFALLSRLRPEEQICRTFARWAVTNALGLLATAALFSSSTSAEAARSRGWQLACMGLAAFFLPELVSELTRTPLRREPARWVGAGFAVLAASGLLVDPAGRDGPSIGWLGGLAGLVVAASVAPALFALVSAFPRQPALRPVTLALLVGLAGGLVDLVRLVQGRGAVEVAAHATGLATLAMGAALMRRVVEGEAELERSAALVAGSLEELRIAEAAALEARGRASVGELAAVIAHEVRNPLAVLRNAAASLRKPTTSSVDVETLIEIIQEETRRLDQLGRSLAHFAEPMPYRPEPVRIGPLLEDVVRAVRRAHEGVRGVTLECDVSAELLVRGDPALLRQALINVVDNAVRALPSSGGHVEVGVEEAGSRIRVHVRDDGEGMSDAVLTRAKDPFFTTRATGTGLGLALVDKVVKLHGGELSLARREPRGTEVTFTLARAPADSPSGAHPSHERVVASGE